MTHGSNHSEQESLVGILRALGLTQEILRRFSKSMRDKGCPDEVFLSLRLGTPETDSLLERIVQVMGDSSKLLVDPTRVLFPLERHRNSFEDIISDLRGGGLKTEFAEALGTDFKKYWCSGSYRILRLSIQTTDEQISGKEYTDFIKSDFRDLDRAPLCAYLALVESFPDIGTMVYHHVCDHNKVLLIYLNHQSGRLEVNATWLDAAALYPPSFLHVMAV